MSKFIDLTGMKFERLLVVKRTEDHIQKNGRRRVRYLCKCDCGNEVFVNSESLKSGNSKSCGCLTRESCRETGLKHGGSNKENLIGKTFGKLTVIEETYKRNKSRCVIYKCLCVCGNITEVPSSSLKSNNSKSCGGCNNNIYKETIYGYMECITAKGEVIKFDKEDFELIKTRQWFVHGLYARASLDYKQASMHIFLLGEKKGFVIDHINGDKLDNRRSNLRYATIQENARNTRKKEGCTSKYKGVYYAKRQKKWQSYIYFDKKKYMYLGLYKTEEEAAIAYNTKAKEIFGEFAKLNVIKIKE